MSAQRWIYVDDSDSNIDYSGSWTAISGANYDHQGNFGPTYKSTLHETTASQASFSYTYEGSSGRIIGTESIKNSSGVIDPTWSCQVDGTNISPTAPFAFTENNWVLCSWDNISPGQHTFTLTAHSNGQPFLFDILQYLPSPNANIQNAVVSVGYNDPAIQFGSGWGALGTIATMATNGGANMKFPFYGTGVVWYGDIPIELPPDASSAQYSVDGQDPVTFTVPGQPTGSGSTQYNQFVFQTPTLPLGSHTLSVTSLGQTSLTPLVLSFLLIQNGATQVPTSASGSSSSALPVPGSGTSSSSVSVSGGPGASSSTKTLTGGSISPSGTGIGPGMVVSGTVSITLGQSVSPSGSNLPSNLNPDTSHPSSSSKSTLSIGPIVGGVVGGIIVIALLILSICLYRRHRRKTVSVDQVQPFYRDVPAQPAHSLYNQSEYESSGGSGPYSTTQNGNTNAIISSGKGDLVQDFHQTSGSRSPLSYVNSSSGRQSLDGSNASSALLLQPNRANSQYQESTFRSDRGEQVAHFTHEDSGLRIPRETQEYTLPSQIVEYPPVYSPA